MKKPFYKILMHDVMKLLVKDALVLAQQLLLSLAPVNVLVSNLSQNLKNN